MNQCGHLESDPEVVVSKGVASSSFVREPVLSLCSEVDVGRGVGLGRVTMTVVVGRQVRVLFTAITVVVDEFRSGLCLGEEATV